MLDTDIYMMCDIIMEHNGTRLTWMMFYAIILYRIYSYLCSKASLCDKEKCHNIFLVGQRPSNPPLGEYVMVNSFLNQI